MKYVDYFMRKQLQLWFYVPDLGQLRDWNIQSRNVPKILI